jgi:hypothetical protein
VKTGRVPAVLITVALLGLAFLVRATQPSDEAQLRPFVANAGLEQRVEGRDMVFTATDAYLADRVTTGDWIGDTEGVWLIIDATIGSKLGIATPEATLTIGDLRYTASDRPGDSALGETLDPGLPQSGSFLFELPLSVIEGPEATHARARFATSFEVRLDSAIDLTLDLTSLRHEMSATLQDPGLALQ